jgi:hypothetical protein
MAKYKKIKLSEARARIEQIDEISKEKARKYIPAAASDYQKRVDDDARPVGTDTKQLKNRRMGHLLASKKIAGTAKVNATEEVELEEGKMKEIITKHMDAGLSYEEALKKAQKKMKKMFKEQKKLIGNQKKIDKNHNGKLDAQDFKMLRSKKMEEETEADMVNTSMGGADQIATSSTGEIYKKSAKKTTGPSPATGTETHVVAGKTGEAYNTTGITKRVPAVESAAMSVFTKTLEKRRLFEDASNIAIISPEQRQDWLDVSTGKMDVANYLDKYKV